MLIIDYYTFRGPPEPGAPKKKLVLVRNMKIMSNHKGQKLQGSKDKNKHSSRIQSKHSSRIQSKHSSRILSKLSN